MTTKQRRWTEEEIAAIENSRAVSREDTARFSAEMPERVWRILLAHGDINEDGEWTGDPAEREWWDGE